MIPATSSTQSAPLREAASSRAHLAGLFWTLIRTDFKARYHGTFGGFAWALMKPLVMFLSLIAVFSFVFSTEIHYKRNLLLGLFLWDFFSEATRAGLTSLHQKGFLLTKARFPTWILVVASISNAFITLSVFSISMLVYLFSTSRAPGALDLALFAAYVFLLIVIVIGISLTTSSLFLRYRDLNQIWDVVTQAGFFLTPIIWPIGAIPEKYHFYLYIWPPTPIVDFARQVLISGTIPSPRANLLLAVEAAVILVTGMLVFRRLSPRAAEYL